MSMRTFLTLCAGLAVALGAALWLPPATPPQHEQVLRETADEHLVESTQAPTPTLLSESNNSNTPAQVANTRSPATVLAEEVEANPNATSSAQPAVNNSSPSASARNATTSSQEEPAGPVLSKRVFAVIEDVQQKQMDGQWEESLLELNELYEYFDQLNSFEQTVMLNFYTNTLLRYQMWPEAIGAFSRMLTIPDLRPDLGARALVALGQLHAQVGEYAASISYLTSWQNLTAGMENMEGSNKTVAELLAQSRAALQQNQVEGQ